MAVGDKSWRISWWDNNHWGWVADNTWSAPSAEAVYQKLENIIGANIEFTTVQLLKVLLKSTKFRKFVRAIDWAYSDTKPLRGHLNDSMQKRLALSIINAILGHLLVELSNGEKQQVYTIKSTASDNVRSKLWVRVI